MSLSRESRQLSSGRAASDRTGQRQPPPKAQSRMGGRMVGLPDQTRSDNIRVPAVLERRALGSVVEHRLHTAGVSGSNPLAPTIVSTTKHTGSRTGVRNIGTPVSSGRAGTIAAGRRAGQAERRGHQPLPPQDDVSFLFRSFTPSVSDGRRLQWASEPSSCNICLITTVASAQPKPPLASADLNHINSAPGPLLLRSLRRYVRSMSAPLFTTSDVKGRYVATSRIGIQTSCGRNRAGFPMRHHRNPYLFGPRRDVRAAPCSTKAEASG